MPLLPYYIIQEAINGPPLFPSYIIYMQEGFSVAVTISLLYIIGEKSVDPHYLLPVYMGSIIMYSPTKAFLYIWEDRIEQCKILQTLSKHENVQTLRPSTQ